MINKGRQPSCWPSILSPSNHMRVPPLLKKNEIKVKVVRFGKLIRQNVCRQIVYENKNILINFNILTFFKVKRSQRSSLAAILNAYFLRQFWILFWYCSLKYFRCIQHAMCQIFLCLPPNPQFFHKSAVLLEFHVSS